MGSAHASRKLNLFKAFRFIFETADILVPHASADIPRLTQYRGADKSLARPTSRCILFDGENISFDASLVIYIYIYIKIVLIFLQLR